MVHKNGRVTIKDVAKTAGVSIAMVFRAMRGNYYVSPEICSRVRGIIEELGFLPDSRAVALKSKYRYMIGYLASDISNYQFTPISRTIEDTIEGDGYSLIVCSNDSQGPRELKSLKALLSHRMMGLSLIPQIKTTVILQKSANPCRWFCCTGILRKAGLWGIL
jgi:LacI family transcriptional regulator